MQPITVTRHAAAPPETVWAVATDVADWEQVLSGVDKVEVLSPPGPFGTDLRWRETRTIAGRSATEVMWVTAVDPVRAYTVEADSRGAHYVSTFTFTATGDGGTDVTLSFDTRVHGALRRVVQGVLGRVMAGAVGKQLGRDLDDVVAEAERRAAAG
ncbi:MAG TPA: SRPBCC family protein [Jiangellales bacterium]|nr:SRPBCC family protein [Jiangellales bacterium]